MLSDCDTIGFVPVADLDRALAFYRDILELDLIGNDGFSLMFRSGGQMIRIVGVDRFSPQPFTILGWEVSELVSTVEDLSTKGVSFLRYPEIDQDKIGIWTTAGGDQVAWFNDPDGNVLSLSATFSR